MGIFKGPKWKQEGFDSKDQWKASNAEAEEKRRIAADNLRLREVYEKMGHRPKFSFSGTDAKVFVRMGQRGRNNLENIVDEGRDAVMAAETSIQHAGFQLDAKNYEMEALQNQITQMNERIAAAEGEVTLAQDALNRANASHQEYHSQATSMADRAHAIQHIVGHDVAHDIEEARHEAIADSALEATRNVEAATAAKTDLVRQKRELSARADAFGREIAELTGQIDAEKERADETQEAVQNLINATEWSPLDSMQTISISIHESKGPVRCLGNRGPTGYTRSSVTIAGTMIVTIIDTHPLLTLLEADNTWLGMSLDNNTMLRGSPNSTIGASQANTGRRARNATRLSPFDIMIRYVSEVDQGSMLNPYGRGYEMKQVEVPTGRGIETEMKNAPRGLLPSKAAQRAADDMNKYDEIAATMGYYRGAYLKLVDVEIIDQSIVSSVNDITTEMVFNFVAMNYLDFQANHMQGQRPNSGPRGNVIAGMNFETQEGNSNAVAAAARSDVVGDPGLIDTSRGGMTDQEYDDAIDELTGDGTRSLK